MRFFIGTAICILGIATGCELKKDRDTDLEQARYNVIFILADDLGYGDLGCYGQQVIRTPNIDQLALEGMKFTDYYAGNTVCAPSRCALMTGKHMGHAYIRANSLEPLRETDSTLAQVFKKKGYMTGMFGKWGLGEFGSTGTPEKKGFDRFMGFLNQMDAHKYYFDSMEVIRNGDLLQISIDSTRYTQDIIMEAAFDFVIENREDPFFLYLPVTIPHAELSVPGEDLKPYLDENGESIFEEAPFEGNWLYRPQKMPKAAFAAMVSRLDKDIGKLVDLLEELGLKEKTFIFFTSDNGPHAEGGIDPSNFDSNGPLRGFKRDLYEGGIRVPMIALGPHIPSNTINTSPAAFWDILPTFGEMLDLDITFPHDGISIWSSLMDPSAQIAHPYLYWEHYIGWEKKFTQAIRQGEWKALRIGVADQPLKLELYNLESDPGEQNNLASGFPERTNEMVRLMESASIKPENETFIYYKDIFTD